MLISNSRSLKLRSDIHVIRLDEKPDGMDGGVIGHTRKSPHLGKKGEGGGGEVDRSPTAGS